MDAKQEIEEGKACLGIELGSTRIKAVLIGTDFRIIAVGSHSWENSLQNGVWTYPLSEVHAGLQTAYRSLVQNTARNYACKIVRLRALGISAMMHGYLVFDSKGRQLVEFRTWRNTSTGEAADQLSQLFRYNIPQRWSIAHLYQAVLNGEEHVKDLGYITTLSGYIHWQLSGEKILGIGDASGMFPVDTVDPGMPKEQVIAGFDKSMQEQFDRLVKPYNFTWKLAEIMPKVAVAGQNAGMLSERGARLLDPQGDLQAGIPLCPPEGDAGTGMTATNSVAVRTGNVSAGTSVFAMLVLEAPLSRMRREIDLVSTPAGLPAAMAHCNNGSSDIDAWIALLGEAARLLGADVETGTLYDKLFRHALKGDADCGGLLNYGYVAGEDLAGLSEGRPLFVRHPQNALGLANFMRSQLYSSLCALKIGLDILMRDEGVQVDEIRGHGGFFKTGEAGQRIMAAAANTPVTVLKEAGEGGAWGIALLASYLFADCSLPDFLEKIFAHNMGKAMPPNSADVAGFQRFFERYKAGLKIEQTAAESLH